MFLLAGLVGLADQLNLGLFEANGSRFALFDEPQEGAGVARDPHILDRVAKELAHAGLVQEAFGHARKEDGARGQALGVLGRHQVGLAQVDIINTFSADHKQNKTEEEPRNDDVGVELDGRGDVANGQEVELLQVLAAGGIDGQQDGPGNDTAGKADGGQHAQVPQKEKAVEGCIVEDKGLVNVPEILDPGKPCRRQCWDRDKRIAADAGNGSWRIDTLAFAAEHDEDGEADAGVDEDGDEGAAERGGRRRVGAGGGDVAEGAAGSVVAAGADPGVLALILGDVSGCNGRWYRRC